MRIDKVVKFITRKASGLLTRALYRPLRACPAVPPARRGRLLARVFANGGTRRNGADDLWAWPGLEARVN